LAQHQKLNTVSNLCAANVFWKIVGGEGLFLATLEGTGTVWMQSLPFSRMADRIIQSAPSAGGHRTDEGSALTGRLGDVANGDGFGFKLF
jgi:hypothetical protein